METETAPITISEKTAWPKDPIEKYKKIEDGEWGYVVIYSDASHEFIDTERPTNEEIMARWGYLFKGV